MATGTPTTYVQTAETLMVSAEAAWESSATDPYIIVRVRDGNGKALAGLTYRDIKVVRMGHVFKAADLGITSASGYGAPQSDPAFKELVGPLVLAGTYSIRLDGARLPELGQFVFTVVVTSTIGAVGVRPIGQTLVAVAKSPA